MLDLQTISDRIEIQDLMTRYASIIDRNLWDDYSSLFTDDACVDYTGTGGLAGSVPEMLEFLKGAFATLSASQHMLTNFEVDLNGDSASVRCMLHNPMVWDAEGNQNRHIYGVWYVLELVRMEDQWRIARLAQELAYHTGPLP